jgi:hypothetical protein
MRFEGRRSSTRLRHAGAALLAIAGLSPGARPGAAQSPTPPVFNGANGHWYQTVRVPGGIVWAEARAAAEALAFGGYRGHLATVTSAEENEFLAQHVLPSARNYGGLWLGGYQDTTAPDYREPGGGWRWVTGEPWNDTHWHPGEPNNAGPEHALHFTGNNHTWNDLNGTQAIDGYIVEYEPPATPTTARIGILPNPVVGGTTTVGVVTLDRPAAPGDVMVPLTSSDAAVAAVPAVVIVPAGATTALFSIVTFPASAPAEARITATGPGGPRAATLQALPAGQPMPPGNLLVNGSFEQPRVPAGEPHATLRGGGLPGWRITRGTLEVVSTGWQQAPGEGTQSLDLVGSPGAATIQQSFATVPGREYLFSGWVGHNPDTPGSEARANVLLNGQFFVQLYHRDLQTTGSDMRWVRFAYRFRAAAATTTLAVADVTGAWEMGGTALDGLAVTAVEPNLLMNGSFEEPDAGSAADGVRPIAPGGLPGWRLLLGPVELLHERLWQPAPGQGLQSLHLSGDTGAGGIQQVLLTEPGGMYRLSGWLSHHPSVSEGRAHLYVDGEFWAPLLHSAALHGPTAPGAMQWQPFFTLFRASGPTLTLTFVDATGGPGGAVLDGLVVTPSEEPAPGRPPAAPTRLTVRLIAPMQVELAWRDNSAEETSFEIQRRTSTGDWERIATIAANAARFTDFGVSPRTRYAYRVRAVNESGASGWSNEASVTTLGP